MLALALLDEIRQLGGQQLRRHDGRCNAIYRSCMIIHASLLFLQFFDRERINLLSCQRNMCCRCAWHVVRTP